MMLKLVDIGTMRVGQKNQNAAQELKELVTLLSINPNFFHEVISLRA